MGRASATIAGLLLVATGCAGGYNNQENLRDRVSHFNDAVRWGLYHRAAAWIDEDERAGWLSGRSEWGSDLRIADYEVVDTQLEDDGQAATVRVVVSWYRLSQSELQTSMLQQRWQRRQRDWIMASEEVVEGEPL